MTNKSSRYNQLTTNLVEGVVSLTANNRIINYIYLFSKKEDMIVGIYSLDNCDKHLNEFKQYAEVFTKQHPDYIVMTSRNNVIIDDNNFFMCLKGVWVGVNLSTYSNVTQDTTYLFVNHIPAILRETTIRCEFSSNGFSTCGLLDQTITAAFHSGKNMVAHQLQTMQYPK